MTATVWPDPPLAQTQTPLILRYAGTLSHESIAAAPAETQVLKVVPGTQRVHIPAQSRKQVLQLPVGSSCMSVNELVEIRS